MKSKLIVAAGTTVVLAAALVHAQGPTIHVATAGVSGEFPAPAGWEGSWLKYPCGQLWENFCHEPRHFNHCDTGHCGPRPLLRVHDACGHCGGACNGACDRCDACDGGGCDDCRRRKEHRLLDLFGMIFGRKSNCAACASSCTSSSCQADFDTPTAPVPVPAEPSHRTPPPVIDSAEPQTPAAADGQPAVVEPGTVKPAVPPNVTPDVAPHATPDVPPNVTPDVPATPDQRKLPDNVIPSTLRDRIRTSKNPTLRLIDYIQVD